MQGLANRVEGVRPSVEGSKFDSVFTSSRAVAASVSRKHTAAVAFVASSRVVAAAT